MQPAAVDAVDAAAAAAAVAAATGPRGVFSCEVQQALSSVSFELPSSTAVPSSRPCASQTSSLGTECTNR